MGERGWLKRFGTERRPGAYLRVVRPGDVRAGDEVRVLDRPSHGVTIGDSYHAWMHDTDRLREYVGMEDLPEGLRADIRRRLRL